MGNISADKTSLKSLKEKLSEYHGDIKTVLDDMQTEITDSTKPSFTPGTFDYWYNGNYYSYNNNDDIDAYNTLCSTRKAAVSGYNQTLASIKTEVLTIKNGCLKSIEDVIGNLETVINAIDAFESDEETLGAIDAITDLPEELSTENATYSELYTYSSSGEAGTGSEGGGQGDGGATGSGSDGSANTEEEEETIEVIKDGESSDGEADEAESPVEKDEIADGESSDGEAGGEGEEASTSAIATGEESDGEADNEGEEASTSAIATGEESNGEAQTQEAEETGDSISSGTGSDGSAKNGDESKDSSSSSNNSSAITWSVGGAGALAGAALGATGLGDANLEQLSATSTDGSVLGDLNLTLGFDSDSVEQYNLQNGISSTGWSSYDDAVAAGYNVLTEEEFNTLAMQNGGSYDGCTTYQEYLNKMYNQYRGETGSVNKIDMNAINGAISNAEEGTGNVDGNAMSGAAALFGSAIIGGAIAAGAGDNGINQDDPNMREIMGNSQSGNAKDGANGIFFNNEVVSEEETEEEKKEKLKKKITFISSVSALFASITTFIIGSLEYINPIWFILAIILLLIATIMYMLCNEEETEEKVDKLNKAKLQNSRGNIKDIEQYKLKLNNEMKNKWMIYGTLMFSSVFFILKIYNIISWLWLIILLLIILGIAGYLIYKMHEQSK